MPVDIHAEIDVESPASVAFIEVRQRPGRLFLGGAREGFERL